MALTFDQWSPDDEPGEVVDVSTDVGWEYVHSTYASTNDDAPLRRIIEIAKAHGVESVIVERRYIDADWRDEHTNFYGSTFRRYPSVCHRLHFFAAHIDESFSNIGDHVDKYRGFSVMRPLPDTPVGRTMIQPPPELAGATVVEATEPVNLFGVELSVTAMPFISQDAQYLRCAHASMWMVLRHASLRHGLPKRLPSDVREAAVGGHVIGRQMPSDGLSVAQMLDALDRLGLPSGRIAPAPDTGPDVRPPAGSLSLYGVLCRYVNSDLPPIVVSDCHAWVVVGWDRNPSEGHGSLTVWRHDDARGPYIRVENPWDEPERAHQPWKFVLTPLMPGMNVDAERAEATGAAWLTLATRAWATDADGNSTRVAEVLAAGDLAFQTYAVASNDYKARLGKRGLDPALAQLYRTTHLPKYIWVVEASDRKAREASEPCVLGEVIIDSTHASPDPQPMPGALCVHVDGTAISLAPDHGTVRQADITDTGAYLSDRNAR